MEGFRRHLCGDRYSYHPPPHQVARVAEAASNFARFDPPDAVDAAARDAAADSADAVPAPSAQPYVYSNSKLERSFSNF